jgi:hypothetical protein
MRAGAVNADWRGLPRPPPQAACTGARQGFWGAAGDGSTTVALLAAAEAIGALPRRRRGLRGTPGRRLGHNDCRTAGPNDRVLPDKIGPYSRVRRGDVKRTGTSPPPATGGTVAAAA